MIARDQNHDKEETTFNHTDQLGSCVAQSNFGLTLTATQSFDAFGLLVSSTGTPAGPFGFAGDPGYQTDASGLMLLGHRYYDASTGRFITRDPAQDGRNWYDYVANNPLRLVDGSGHSWQSIAGHFALGVGIGVAIGVGVILLAPVAVAGLTAVGVAEAAGVVTTGLLVAGSVGTVVSAGAGAIAIRDKDWDGLATIIGSAAGGGLVGGFGGGRVLAGMGGKPSPAPRMSSIGELLGYEWGNRYQPSMGPPGLKWFNTCPTPAAGTVLLSVIGASGGPAGH